MLWGYMRHRICPADWSQALSSELNLEEGAAWKCEDTRGSRETVWCDWGGLKQIGVRGWTGFADKDHNVKDFLSFCIYFS